MISQRFADLVANLQEIGDRTLILAAPQADAVLDPHQLARDPQIAAPLPEPSGHDCAYAKLAADVNQLVDA